MYSVNEALATTRVGLTAMARDWISTFRMSGVGEAYAPLDEEDRKAGEMCLSHAAHACSAVHCVRS
jgi:hypothetical protein